MQCHFLLNFCTGRVQCGEDVIYFELLCKSAISKIKLLGFTAAIWCLALYDYSQETLQTGYLKWSQNVLFLCYMFLCYERNWLQKYYQYSSLSISFNCARLNFYLKVIQIERKTLFFTFLSMYNHVLLLKGSDSDLAFLLTGTF